jgi:hypothetical protein
MIVGLSERLRGIATREYQNRGIGTSGHLAVKKPKPLTTKDTKGHRGRAVIVGTSGALGPERNADGWMLGNIDPMPSIGRKSKPLVRVISSTNAVAPTCAG